jgi:predicted ribosome quality control (RQC) complex YloA/Tae2 family protein
MHYSLLKAWCLEASTRKLRVESVWIGSPGLCLRFKEKEDLALVISREDAFPFFEPSRPNSPTGEKVWNQLTHAELSSISIDPADRIIRFCFRQSDIYGENSLWQLVAELAPPHPNLILARQERELMIVDALNKYGYADNPQRQILPRLPYQPPQTSFRPQEQELSLPLNLTSLATGETLSCPSFNAYFQAYFTHVLQERMEQEHKKRLLGAWNRELSKAASKLAKQEAELEDASRQEHWRICAETIKHNLSALKTGQTSLKAVNYFDPYLAKIEIPLQAERSPHQNLQYYLKKYQKAKRGAEIIASNLAATRKELEHLQNIIARVEEGSFTELPAKNGIASLGKKLALLDRLLRLRVNDEFEIVIGRKATENDYVTTQLAQPHDWWFHTRIYRGAHVLLRCFKKSTPDDTLTSLCCSLAAWYSKAKFSSNVPVDYTQIRFVRKPRRSAPGYVTYSKHSTVFSQPKDLRAVRAELGL